MYMYMHMCKPQQLVGINARRCTPLHEAPVPQPVAAMQKESIPCGHGPALSQWTPPGV